MILSINNIGKSFGDEAILEDISFIIEEKEKAALTGVNGAGKTTLFNIIAGDLKEDYGSVIVSKAAKIAYLPQGSKIESNISVYEELLSVFEETIEKEKLIREYEYKMNISDTDNLKLILEKYNKLITEFEEMDGYSYKSRIKGVIAGLGFIGMENSVVSSLSGGEKTRLALARELLLNPDLLLLDEPTNHLDISAITWLEGYLKGFDGAVLIISHDRYFIDTVADKIIEIENKKSVVYNCKYSEYTQKKTVIRNALLHQYTAQQKEIKKQEESIKLLKSYNREKTVKRAESKEKLLNKMTKIERPDNKPGTMKLRLVPKITSGNDVLIVDGASKKFGDRLIFSNVSFDLKKGDKIAIIGPNGVGKTTLLKMILGETNKDSGNITTGANVKIGYYDQERQSLNESLSIFDEISNTYPELNNVEIRNTLAAFLFTGEDVFKKVGMLSGGEKGRVSVAKILLSGANFLILDEPTNHLDMQSKEILESALQQYQGTILFVSHDRFFINSVANKVIELSINGIDLYYGNYSYYIDKKNKRKIETINNALSNNLKEFTEKNKNKDSWVRKKEENASERKMANYINKIENEIEQLEIKIKGIDEKLYLDEFSTDAFAAKELFDERTEVENELVKLYEEWEKFVDTNSSLKQ